MRTGLIMVGALAVVGIALVSIVGIFWIIDIAPLLLFIGAGVVYGLLSNQSKRPLNPPLSRPSELTKLPLSHNKSMSRLGENS